MNLLLGKQYSIETNKTIEFLIHHKIEYTYVDLEHDDDAAFWMDWIKANKIISIPVLLEPHTYQFVVGYDSKALAQFLPIITNTK